MSMRLKDKLQKKTKALPNGAASTTSDFLDTEQGSRGDQVAPMELLISAPALGATPLPDAKTMKYDVLYSSNSDGSSPTTYAKEVIVQTGASSAGDDADEARVKIPSNGARYWGVKATGSASGDASGSSFTVEMVF